MAGKTGTAQTHNLSAGERGDYTGAMWKLRDHSLFMAFVPFDNPRYAAAAIVEHGGFGAAVAAPLVRDTLTCSSTTSKRRSPRLRPFEQSIGGTLEERARAQDCGVARGQRAAAAPAQAGMITSAIIPRPLARLPWRLIFLVAGIAGVRADRALFGRRRLDPALGDQAGDRLPRLPRRSPIGMSWMSESTIKAIAFPLYGVTLVMLIGVEALGFVSKGAQRWLDLGPIRLQPSEFMKPAIVLTLARFYELVPAGEIRKWRAIWPALAAARRPRLPDPRPARPRHLHHGAAVRRDGDVPRRPAVVAVRRPGGGRSRSRRRSSTR